LRKPLFQCQKKIHLLANNGHEETHAIQHQDHPRWSRT
jgi:hypothetical protein